MIFATPVCDPICVFRTKDLGRFVEKRQALADGKSKSTHRSAFELAVVTANARVENDEAIGIDL